MTPRYIRALAIVNCTAGDALQGWSAGSDADSQADWVCVGNSLLSATARAISWNGFASGGYSQLVRPLVLNNVMERIGGSTEPMRAVAENALERMTHGVIEGNTFVGKRANVLYKDPGDLVSHNTHVDCRVANNFFDWMPTKHDDFFDDTTAAANGVPGYPSTTGATAPFGYRPALTDNLGSRTAATWRATCMAGDSDRATSHPRGYGIGAVINPSAATGQGNAWAKFTTDKSRMGDYAGGGDYRPTGGSPLIGVASRANMDVDRAGALRGSAFAAGALEPAR